MDDQRRAQLLAAKLAGITGMPSVGDGGGFGGGAAALYDGRAHVLLDRPAALGLGAALAWAVRNGAVELTVYAEQLAGTLARRAAGFTFPVEVRLVDGRDTLPAVPEPLPTPPVAPVAHLAFEADIAAAGAQPIIEHAVLTGEVAGLEVCRVVDDPHTGAVRLEVGTGAHDREMFQMLHGDRPTVEALADVVRTVAGHRSPGTPRHPLNLLAQERLLRARLAEHPELIAATVVTPAPPPVPRANVKDPTPCVAIATIDGRRVAVVCSVGVDLEVVPYAVDACAALGLDEGVVVVPARDAVQVQQRLAALARARISVVGVEAVA